MADDPLGDLMAKIIQDYLDWAALHGDAPYSTAFTEPVPQQGMTLEHLHAAVDLMNTIYDRHKVNTTYDGFFIFRRGDYIQVIDRVIGRGKEVRVFTTTGEFILAEDDKILQYKPPEPDLNFRFSEPTGWFEDSIRIRRFKDYLLGYWKGVW